MSGEGQEPGRPRREAGSRGRLGTMTGLPPLLCLPNPRQKAPIDTTRITAIARQFCDQHSDAVVEVHFGAVSRLSGFRDGRP